MNNIDMLSKYSKKNADLKRLKHRLQCIDLKLENWDRVKAANISDMPTHRESSKGNSIVERSLSSREDLLEERKKLEIEIADLNTYFVDIECKLDCLDYALRWILEKIYVQGYWSSRSKEVLYKQYLDEVGIVERGTFNKTVWFARNEFNKIH